MGQIQSTDNNGIKTTTWRLGPFYYEKTGKGASLYKSNHASSSSSSSYSNANPVMIDM